jgi:hypothetical protein
MYRYISKCELSTLMSAWEALHGAETGLSYDLTAKVSPQKFMQHCYKAYFTKTRFTSSATIELNEWLFKHFETIGDGCAGPRNALIHSNS